MATIIGIDLGTTNSVVAVVEGGTPTVIANAEGQRITPSVVAFPHHGQPLIGTAAKRQAASAPQDTIYSIKRFIGRRRSEVVTEEGMVPYRLVGETEEPAKVAVGEQYYSPSEISAYILRELKKTAEAYLGHKVDRAVITVPAYFNDGQRQATKDAGKLAGLEVERIINEPTAAALAYGLDKKTNQTIAVFDLGGGTFDISILQVKDGIFQVLSTNGDTHLGGDDFDQLLVVWLAAGFQEQHDIDLRRIPVALQRLREAAERAKCELSETMEVTVNLPFIANGPQGPLHLQQSLKRQTLEQLTAPLIGRTAGPCRQALADAGLGVSAIDEVILVGGATRMPAVRQAVQELFQQQPNFQVNPDEVVAMGAAIQGAILSRHVLDVLLLDVTPLSLGIETYGGAMSKIIPRNTTIPTQATERFSTFVDHQTSVDLHILQGERELAADNRTLGRFQLRGIPPMSHGMPQVQVSFVIDANGILNVTAKELLSGQEIAAEIKALGGLSEAEIDQMVMESVEHAETDMARRMLIEARNETTQVIEATHKALSHYTSSLDGEHQQAIAAALSLAEQAVSGDDVEAIQAATAKLDEATRSLADMMVTEAIKHHLDAKEASLT